jgi:hypothetical protein
MNEDKESDIEKVDPIQVGIYKYNQEQVSLLESIFKVGLPVKIENINMPFAAMVGLMLKIALASIPAIIILSLFFFFVSIVFSVLIVGGIGSLLTLGQ